MHDMHKLTTMARLRQRRGEQAAGRVSIAAPREIAANSTLNPRSLGGDYLDATRMTGGGEILVLPAQGSSDENVRVENLTIAGGSQRLDAIHWTNVTFVGTEVRYEKGPLDLENVHFVRCTFSFAPDVGGVAPGECNRAGADVVHGGVVPRSLCFR